MVILVGLNGVSKETMVMFMEFTQGKKGYESDLPSGVIKNDKL